MHKINGNKSFVKGVFSEWGDCMDSEQLHPSVKQFKDFISKHPHLISEIRKDNAWQSYYEKWVLLGEDDPFWDQYKETSAEEENMELLNKLVKLSDQIDMAKIQKQVGSLN